MAKPIIDLGPGVIPLNSDSVRYHMALQAANNDLYLIFCHDLWGHPQVATKEASEAFAARFRGKYPFMLVPIAPESAAEIADSVLVAEDIVKLP